MEGQRVDLLYRDLDVVQHWLNEAEAGRYELDLVEGYLAGMASYVLVGELAQAEVLAGELPRPEFPDALRLAAPGRWLAARPARSRWPTRRRRADVVACAGLLAKAAIEAAQAALAERGEWALSERGIVRRAGLGSRVVAILAAPGDRPFELARAVTAMRGALGIPRGGRRRAPDRVRRLGVCARPRRARRRPADEARGHEARPDSRAHRVHRHIGIGHSPPGEGT